MTEHTRLKIPAPRIKGDDLWEFVCVCAFAMITYPSLSLLEEQNQIFDSPNFQG